MLEHFYDNITSNSFRLLIGLAQLSGAAEYTDYIPAKE